MSVEPLFTSKQLAGVEVVEVPVDESAVADRLSRAVRFRTQSNQDRDDFDEQAFRDFHDFLQQSFPKVHATLSRETVGAPRAFSLLYTWPGTDPTLPPVVLMGHQDVVPVVPGTEDQWEHDAYSGDIADGYVWGRGSLDDKGMVMAILEAVEMHLTDGFTPRRTTYLAFGQDEEVMGGEGMSHLVHVLQGRGVTEVALVLDEGVAVTTGLFPGVAAPMALIGTAEKGYVSVELKVDGVGGHSAMPPAQSNIGILAQAVTRLEANPPPYRITQAVRDQFRFLGAELPPNAQGVIAAMLATDDDTPTPAGGGGEPAGDSLASGYAQAAHGRQQFITFMSSSPQTDAMLRTTTAVTMFNGGVKENVLPPIVTAVVNFRILAGETVESVVQHVRDVVRDDRIQVTALPSSIDPSPVSDPEGDAYRVIERSIRQTWGDPGLVVAPYLVIGGCDAKYFARAFGGNVFRFTAVRVESAADTARWHGVNERVLTAEHAKSVAFFHHLLTNAENL